MGNGIKNMKLFLKDNKGYIFTYTFSVMLTIAYCSMMSFIELSESVYIIFFNFTILSVFLGGRYYKTKEVYKTFENGVNDLNESYRDLGNSLLGENISRLLKNQYTAYEDEIQKSNKVHQEHLTFINQWVHQMKTPLSVIGLIIQDNEGEEPIDSIKGQISKINKGLNMVIYFARIDSFQKDFIAEKFSLYTLVKDKINEEKQMFISSKVSPRVEIDKSIEIYSDKKWMKFVLEQIITNAIKYSVSDNKELLINANKDGNTVYLEVIDKGIGVPKKDIKRVFDPFFTGENGRRFGESTGMGLYIAKRVCDNLNHIINIESKVGLGTKISIVFNK